MSRDDKSRMILLAGLVCYLSGFILCYFFWYKNGEVLHFQIIALAIGGCATFVLEYKARNIILKRFKQAKVLITILFISIFMGGFVYANNMAKERVQGILTYEPTMQAVAIVVAIDLRSTRSGKQPWSIINYKVSNQIVEQAFADTRQDLKVGNKYLVQYSVEYPDMYRILKTLE